MATKEDFIRDLCSAVQESNLQDIVEEKLRGYLKEWSGPPPWLGPPAEAGFPVLYEDDNITIMSIVWPPHLITEPHNHNMWATIGLYEGRENNILWQRNDTSIEPIGAESICAGEVFSLDAQAIHSVHNPLGKYTAALHVYGGNFMKTTRSEWDPEHLSERPRDMAKAAKNFKDADPANS